jgi:hypothetical protein
MLGPLQQHPGAHERQPPRRSWLAGRRRRQPPVPQRLRKNKPDRGRKTAPVSSAPGVVGMKTVPIAAGRARPLFHH